MRSVAPWDRAVVLAASMLAAVVAGCGASGGAGSGDLVVATTVAPLVDLVETVAGDRAEVRGLVPPGENGHTYQPRPSDARTLSGADLFIDNGYGLNDVVAGFAFANLPEEAATVYLAESVPEEELIGSPGGCHQGHCHGPVNAHLWPDPLYASQYVDAIATALVAEDEAGADEYRRRAEALKGRLAKLHEAIATASATVPEANRKLVVYHDAWAYFARRYDYRMIGALQVVNFAEPSAAEVRSMIDQIKAEGVPAFFGSEVFPSDVLEVVEEATGADYVPDLSDDRLPGRTGDAEHSYVGMMTDNARMIVRALGGDTSAIDAFAGTLR